MPKTPDFSKMTEGEALYYMGARTAEKNGTKGILLPSTDGKGEPLFIQASDERPEAIVASSRKKDRLMGARKTKCADCKRHVWISPSSQEMLKKYPGTPVICIACFMKRADEEEKKQKEAQ